MRWALGYKVAGYMRGKETFKMADISRLGTWESVESTEEAAQEKELAEGGNMRSAFRRIDRR